MSQNVPVYLFGDRKPGGQLYVADRLSHPGAIFWVNSATGTDAVGRGRTPNSALATIDYAVGLCTASAMDTIYVMPGHNEGLGNAQIAVDVAGVSIIGLGRGGLVPRIDFDHASASIDISASNCRIANLRFLPSVTAVLIGIDINTLVTDTLIEDIEVLPGEDGAGVDEFAKVVDLKVGVDRTVIRRLKVRQHASAAGCLSGVSLTGASDDITIEDSDIVILGAGGVAPISGITTLSTNVRIRRNTLVSDDEPGIELLTGTTGSIEFNHIFSNLGSINAAIVADGCASFRNDYVEVGGEGAAYIGTASVDD